jgi:outer membrane lipoprotein SlyB
MQGWKYFSVSFLKNKVKMKFKIRLCAAIATTLLVAGCGAPDLGSSNVYRAEQAQREQTVRMGTIEGVRKVTLNGQSTGLGLLGGAALGAVGGSAIGKGHGSTLAAIAVGLAGAAAGTAIEHAMDKHKALEITVKLDSGDLRSITQADTGEAFTAGDRVRLLSSDGITRVTH